MLEQWTEGALRGRRGGGGCVQGVGRVLIRLLKTQVGDSGENDDWELILCVEVRKKARSTSEVLGEWPLGSWPRLCSQHQQPSYALNSPLRAWGGKGLRTQRYVFRHYELRKIYASVDL